MITWFKLKFLSTMWKLTCIRRDIKKIYEYKEREELTEIKRKQCKWKWNIKGKTCIYMCWSELLPFRNTEGELRCPGLLAWACGGERGDSHTPSGWNSLGLCVKF